MIDNNKIIEEKIGDYTNGFGKIKNENYTYKGNFKDSKFDGHGKITFKKTKDIYIGEFKNGLKNGEGYFKRYLRGYYKGKYKNDLKDGFGEEELLNGYFYKGNYKEDKFMDKGELSKVIYYKTNGNDNIEFGDYIYKGNFLNGLKHGYGVEKYPKDNACYNGMFYKGLKNGYGEWSNKYANFQGTWQNGCKNGYGVEYSSDIDLYNNKNYIYDGYFLNNMKHGIGQYINSNQVFFIGSFFLNKKNGIFLIKNIKLNSIELKFFYNDEEISKLNYNMTNWKFLFDYYYEIYLDLIKNNDYYIDKDFELNINNNEIYYLNNRLYSTEIITEKIQEMSLKNNLNNIYIDYKNKTYLNKIELGKYNDKILLTFIWSLFLDPDNIEKLIDKFTIDEKGFYVFKLFFQINKNIQQFKISVDDRILGTEDYNFYSQFLNNTKNIILTLLEKVWTKYVYINKLLSIDIPVNNNDMLIYLFMAFNNSGYLKLSHDKEKYNKVCKSVKKYMHLDKKIYYFLKKDYYENEVVTPLFLLKVIKSDLNEDIYVFYSLINNLDIEVNNYENLLPNINDIKIKNLYESNSKLILLKEDDIQNIFDNIYIDLYEKNKFNYSMNIEKENDNSLIFYQIKFNFSVKFRNSLNIYINQTNDLNIISPIRIIIGKKKQSLNNNDINYDYYYSKGQILKKCIYLNNIDFSNGEYIWIIQVENNRSHNFNNNFFIQIDSFYTPIKFTEVTHLFDDLKNIYTNLCLSNGKISKLKGRNGKSISNMFNYQYYNKNDNTYIQILDNESTQHIWKQNLNFNLVNMNIIDTVYYSNKPLKFIIGVLERKIIIIQQIGGSYFNFSGGSGAYSISYLQDNLFN